jgi:hypothetical protein
MKKFSDPFGDFKCVNCRTIISADPDLSGVHNRNHCPYCLWSRHMDLYKAGDRLCACKAPMRPVGLALKKAKKKYGSEKQGEMMIIHLCTDCEKLSINRIAADDVPASILEIFEASRRLSASIQVSLQQNGIQALDVADAEIVHARLFGWKHAPTLSGRHAEPSYTQEIPGSLAG